ncbi:SBBP repeat-containing protein [Sorangium cellulosum]|uniref:SBBP repeat-containing protein n=1 Tax=Sorangium cellulosum TaxID=56 RepID=UPI000A6C763C|nr:SBBP repeat-containing protein [Sorangium cellulosum]
MFLAGSANCGLDLGDGPLVGASCSSPSAWVAKIGADGAHLWSRRIEGSIASQAVSLGVDSLGNAFVAGSFTGTLHADGAALGAEDGAVQWFVVRLGRNGNISW